MPSFPLISVIIPALNEEATIASVVSSVARQCPSEAKIEIIVVDDNSSDDTVALARAAGASVLAPDRETHRGNPAAARNRGVAAASGDPLIFLDADCVPADGWLQSLLSAHENGAVIVGGSLALPPGLSFLARCDYYCGWYVVHPRRPAGRVPHHPPPNLSVRRAVFLESSGFTERPPLNEERLWQAQLRRAGYEIYFEPKAVAYHHNHPGFVNLMRRNYFWGYTAIEIKSQTGTARLAWLYQSPRLLIASCIPLAVAHTAYIIGCWLRIGVFEPVVMLPLVLMSRFAYVAGMAVGAVRWLRRRERNAVPLHGC